VSDEVELGISPAAPEKHTGLNGLIFRAITTPQGRRALRLENSFWDALELVCRERGISRNALVAEIAGNRNGELGNLSSNVRSYIVDFLRERSERLARQVEPNALIALMQQAPLPSYAMSRERKLLKVNREFLRMLQLVSGSPSTAISLETIQLSIETPLATIISEIETDNRPHQCAVTISVGNKARKAQTRVVGLPGTPVPAVVGYILP
jgi:predicted DNA-binding ribbon-helix-helix protein